MSTIEVKGTRQSEPAGDKERARFQFLDAEKYSQLPLYFALAVTGVVAYLKSAFPSYGHLGPGDAERPAQPPQQKSAPNIKFVAEAQDQGETPAEEQPGNRIREPVLFPSMSSHYSPIVIEARPRASMHRDGIDFGFDLPAGVPLPAPANDNSPTPAASPDAASQGGDPRVVPAEEDVSDIVPAGEDDDDAAPQLPPPAPTRNRSPVSTGGVRLNDVMAGQAVLIGLSQLLANSADADGDALSIRNVRTSAGSIGTTAEGWVFSSNRQSDAQGVTLTYEVSDGVTTVTQTATFAIAGRVPVMGTSAADILLGLDAADDIDALAGDDIIDARGGDDFIVGGEGADHIVAGTGNDVVIAGAGNDIVWGGAGNDVISGGSGDDRLLGESGDDTIAGDAGDDLISGGDGRDILSGGDGDDVIAGGADDDLIEDGAGRDIVDGGTGSDVVLVALDGTPDSFTGGTGEDVLDLSQATAGLRIDVSAGTAAGEETGPDTISGFEVIISGAGDDEITDGSAGETIIAGSGNDRVTVATDGADDSFSGGAGEDVLDLSLTTLGVTIEQANGTATGSEIGTDSFDGFEVLVGGSGNDTFVVGNTEVTLIGGNGDDAFYFDVSETRSATTTEIIHKILDFMVGDQVWVADYEFRKIKHDGGQDRFERVYQAAEDSLGADEFMIRLRNEATEQYDYAIIEVDHDHDDVFEFSIEVYGSTSPYAALHGMA